MVMTYALSVYIFNMVIGKNRVSAKKLEDQFTLNMTHKKFPQLGIVQTTCKRVSDS